MMIPDVGAGAPGTALWVLTAIFLLGLTIIAGGSLTLLSRALQKRDTADENRDKRLAKLEEKLREQELHSRERDDMRKEEIHGLRVEMLRCQKDNCGRSISKEEYWGDFIRLNSEMKESIQRMEKQLTRVHERIDGFVGNHDAGPK